MALETDQPGAVSVVPRIAMAPGYSCARVINGCWQLARGHGGNMASEPAVFSRFAALVEAGFTTFDCADIYTGVEALLGRFIRSCAVRDRLQVHTKYVPDLPVLARLSRNDIEAGVNRSLARLGVERLDLLQFHWWDYSIPGYLETMDVLNSLRLQGKIRHLGLTNFNQQYLQQILDSGFPVVSVQMQYSLLDRRPQQGMAELCRQNGVQILAYGALAGGLLSQRFLGAAPPGPDNRSLVKYCLVAEEAGGWKRLQSLLASLHGMAAQHGVSIASIAARWVLDQAGVGAIILGTGSRERLTENLRMLKLELTEMEHEEIGRALLQLHIPPGDVFDLERQPSGRHASIMKTSLNAQEESVI